MFIDLSHPVEDGMPGFRMAGADGSVVQYTAKVRPFLTHEQTLPKFDGRCSFEMTEITLQTSIGTYLDALRHRYKDGKDIGEIALEDVILAGRVVDVRGRARGERVEVDALPDLAGQAVLFNFGWSGPWGREEYQSYPHLSSALFDRLIERQVKLVGVDTVNIDDKRDLSRPAHTKLLRAGILILENLRGLEQCTAASSVSSLCPGRRRGWPPFPSAPSPRSSASRSRCSRPPCPPERRRGTTRP
jgi:arylformamidase